MLRTKEENFLGSGNNRNLGSVKKGDGLDGIPHLPLQAP